MRRRRTVMIVLVLFVLAFVSACLPHIKKAESVWTFMLYLNGDDAAMHPDFIKAFHDMIAKQVGSSEDVNIVIQFDRYKDMADFGGWEIAHRFYYMPGMEPTEENAIADWGDGTGGREVNMADPDTLSDFIHWASSNYPAEHYALMVATHGYGWRGLLIDVTSGGDFMTLKEFAGVLENSPVHFDVLAVNACLMQMIEVLHELRNSRCGVVVGSENDGKEWPIADIIHALTSNPQISAEEWSKEIVDLYNSLHEGDEIITLSAVRLAEVPDLVDAFTEMVEVILGDENFPIVQESAATVLQILEDAVVYKKNSAKWQDAGGISIYWPELDQDPVSIPHEYFYFYIDDVTSFARDALWRVFLWEYYRVMDTYPVIPHEIRRIRMELEEFEDPHIDLHQFLTAIVQYEDE